MTNPKQSSSKICYKYYVGQVIEKSGNIYKETFLRGKSTREDNGFIYCFPNVKDECDQVVGRLDKPIDYRCHANKPLIEVQIRF